MALVNVFRAEIRSEGSGKEWVAMGMEIFMPVGVFTPNALSL